MSLLLRELILPPGGILLLVALAFALRARAPRISIRLAVVAVSALYLLSIPPVAHGLAQLTYSEPVLTEQALSDFRPQAIVALGGGRDLTSPEYGGLATPSRHSLQRIRYAAYLAKRTGLPVLAAGGYGALPQQSEAWAIRNNLQEYGLTPRWVETQSRTTSENAVNSRGLLSSSKVERILLVTSSYHARRARLSFEKAGFQVLPAPTGYDLPRLDRPGYFNLVPTSEAFALSSDSLRALLGEVWYRVLGR